jgi:hypothetical protein
MLSHDSQLTRTKEQVRENLARIAAKDRGAAIAMARLYVKFGNITADAREYARKYAEDQRKS